MYANRRDANEREIIAALERAGCVVDRVERRPYDLVVGRGYQNFLLECKAKKGALRASQTQFRRRWFGQYAVVRSPEEALRAVGL